MLATNRQRLGWLVLLMAATSLLTLVTTVYVLYTEALQSRRDWLIDVVRNQAGLIEAIIQDEKTGAERLHDRDWMATTLETGQPSPGTLQGIRQNRRVRHRQA